MKFCEFVSLNRPNAYEPFHAFPHVSISQGTISFIEDRVAVASTPASEDHPNPKTFTVRRVIMNATIKKEEEPNIAFSNFNNVSFP